MRPLSRTVRIPQNSPKRVIRRAPAIRAAVIAKYPAGARSTLVLLRLRGVTRYAIGPSDVKNPTQNDQYQGVQLEKASAGTAESVSIHALTVIANPALACLQVSTMAYAGWTRCW